MSEEIRVSPIIKIYMFTPIKKNNDAQRFHDAITELMMPFESSQYFKKEMLDIASFINVVNTFTASLNEGIEINKQQYEKKLANKELKKLYNYQNILNTAADKYLKTIKQITYYEIPLQVFLYHEYTEYLQYMNFFYLAKTLVYKLYNSRLYELLLEYKRTPYTLFFIETSDTINTNINSSRSNITNNGFSKLVYMLVYTDSPDIQYKDIYLSFNLISDTDIGNILTKAHIATIEEKDIYNTNIILDQLYNDFKDMPNNSIDTELINKFMNIYSATKFFINNKFKAISDLINSSATKTTYINKDSLSLNETINMFIENNIVKLLDLLLKINTAEYIVRYFKHFKDIYYDIPIIILSLKYIMSKTQSSNKRHPDILKHEFYEFAFRKYFISSRIY